MRATAFAAALVLGAVTSVPAWAVSVPSFTISPDPVVSGQPITATVTVSGESKGPVKVRLHYQLWWWRNAEHNATTFPVIGYATLPSLHGTAQVTINAVAPWDVGGPNAVGKEVAAGPVGRMLYAIFTESDGQTAFATNAWSNHVAPDDWQAPSGGAKIAGSFDSFTPAPLVSGKWVTAKVTLSGTNKGPVKLLLAYQRLIRFSAGGHQATGDVPIAIQVLPSLSGTKEVTLKGMAPLEVGWDNHPSGRHLYILYADTGTGWQYLSRAWKHQEAGGDGSPGVAPPKPQAKGSGPTASGAPAAATAQENPATVLVPRSEDWWKAAHERFVTEAKKGGVDVLFLGDSIIDNWRTVGKDVWQERFAPLHAANFGIAGDRTENVLWRLQNGELNGINPKVVVLLIGTNNWMSPDMAAEGIAAVVKHLRTALPKTKILLHGIFPRDRHSKELDKWIKEVNATLAKLHDGKQVHFLDIGEKFLQADGSFLPGLMNDGVHPSAKGYQVWADAIKEPLAKLLAKGEDRSAAGEPPTTEEPPEPKGHVIPLGPPRSERPHGPLSNVP